MNGHILSQSYAHKKDNKILRKLIQLVLKQLFGIQRPGCKNRNKLQRFGLSSPLSLVGIRSKGTTTSENSQMGQQQKTSRSKERGENQK